MTQTPDKSQPPSPDPGLPLHPDYEETPDPVIDALFQKLIDAASFEPDMMRFVRAATVALPVNDPPAPSDIKRHVTARHVKLDKAEYRTTTKGPAGGSAYLDPDGDVFACWATPRRDNPREIGITIFVNGQQAWIPGRAFAAIISRLEAYRTGRLSDTAPDWHPSNIKLTDEDVENEHSNEDD